MILFFANGILVRKLSLAHGRLIAAILSISLGRSIIRRDGVALECYFFRTLEKLI
jgi:hypothetical protein